MKSFIKHTLFLVILMITCFSGFAQNHIMKLGDTLFLKLPAYRGNLQWQESTDSITWKDIAGATYQPYAVKFSTPKYYRGKVTEGSCAAVYTDVTKTILAAVGLSSIEFNGKMYVSPVDNGNGIQWGVDSIITNAVSTTDGKANTAIIVSRLGTNGGTVYAAKVCDTLMLNGYSDWYLPAKDELYAIYLNRIAIGGFSTNLYWSSSENSKNTAWNQNFLDGSQGNDIKAFGDVRCVRRDPVYSVTDIDGNFYDTIRIGQQVWFKQNLKTTKLNDGTAIPNVTGNSAWAILTTPAYCAYNNTTNSDTINTYGLFYDWYAVNTNKLCPVGYHVPSDAEWTVLTSFLGGETGASGKLKEAGTTHWSSPNSADNLSEFSALPAGSRSYYNGSFSNIGNYTYYWSSTESDASMAWLRWLYNTSASVVRNNSLKNDGLSVRCMQDSIVTVSIQQKLNSGKTVKELLTAGVKVDSLYGKSYQGGLIFYVDTINGSGMVAAPSDQGTATWGCDGLAIAGVDSTKVGSGVSNTNKIIANCSETGIAARLCDDLILAGYTDWFLPSKDELNQMYVKLKVNGFSAFVNNSYWSSSAKNAYEIWDQYFADGNQFQNPYKYLSNYVRAVRSFDLPVIFGIKDIDGNTYDTIRIGTQVWFKQNLKTTKYNDGTAIPNVTDNTVWDALTTPAYCAYNNTINADTINTYGLLYNWYTVYTNKLCPVGWHVTSDGEWTTLTTFLGGEAGAGSKLKEVGTTHWLTPNSDATNETNFTALPGGNCYGTFGNIGSNGGWWSSTEVDATYAWARFMNYYDGYVDGGNDDKGSGLAVRCIKD